MIQNLPRRHLDVAVGIFLPVNSIASIESFENTFIDRPFGKLTLSGINAFTVAFASALLEKEISTETATSRCLLGRFWIICCLHLYACNKILKT